MINADLALGVDLLTYSLEAHMGLVLLYMFLVEA